MSPETTGALAALRTVGWQATNQDKITLSPRPASWPAPVSLTVPGGKTEAGTLACATVAM
ncbi:hypothetical protein AMK26_30310 [Streptomyces sp. CB03234]|uniref:hypothetical protein n=1 Tax=Streptomyces sp. (strain CB03234) TaxID=1703937 RepID=UPI00093B88A9|nr:hypothetical protein [Streptomyces sp. CB03234]OKJ94933.1 hypothetical protein AMK26_30310 [Streptomyces sp. CB03234]